MGKVGRFDLEVLKDFTLEVDSGGAVGGYIVGKAYLVWLVNVEHVDLIVPGPRIEDGRAGIFGNEAGAVLLEETHEGGCTGSTIEPDGKRSTLGVLPGLEEPEKSRAGQVIAHRSKEIRTSLTY